MSPDSHNQQTGKQIGETGACAGSSEGCRSLVSILKLLHDRVSGYPFLMGLDSIINKHEDPKVVFQKLFDTK